jgi:hypothetical protein
MSAIDDGVIDLVVEALRVSEQFMDIASDWNLSEVEIDGEMRQTYDIRDNIRYVLGALRDEIGGEK